MPRRSRQTCRNPFQVTATVGPMSPTPSDCWLDATWSFVHPQLPRSPAHVLDMGSGGAGGLVPALRSQGYDAIGGDRRRPRGSRIPPHRVRAIRGDTALRRRRRVHLPAPRPQTRPRGCQADPRRRGANTEGQLPTAAGHLDAAGLDRDVAATRYLDVQFLMSDIDTADRLVRCSGEGPDN